MKKYILIILGIIILGFTTYIIAFNVSKGNDEFDNKELSINKEDNTQNIIDNSTEVKKDDEYKDINVNSEIALEIIEFVPKHFQTELNRMSNEYVIFSSLTNLNKSNINISEGQEYTEYTYDELKKEVTKIYGEDMEITIKASYDYPISYNAENKSFHIIPFGYTVNEYQIAKSLKENSKEFIMELYIINLEYDFLTETPKLLIDSKETFKQFARDKNDFDAIRDTRLSQDYNYEEIDLQTIVDTYGEKLPIVRYTLSKDDERGNSYHIENVDVIY